MRRSQCLIWLQGLLWVTPRPIQKAQPNAAYFQVAQWPQRFDDKVVLSTSYMDDLFEKTGCTNVLHVRGETTHMHCATCALVHRRPSLRPRDAHMAVVDTPNQMLYSSANVPPTTAQCFHTSTRNDESRTMGSFTWAQAWPCSPQLLFVKTKKPVGPPQSC